MRTLVALAVLALAACATTATPDALRDMAGVYSQEFRSGTFDGDSYTVRDELRIRRLGGDRASVSLALNFYNGHSCGIGGVATLEGDTLVLPAPIDEADAPQCRLRIAHAGDVMVIHDPDSACMQQYCGMRGSFEGATLPYSSRRAR